MEPHTNYDYSCEEGQEHRNKHSRILMGARVGQRDPGHFSAHLSVLRALIHFHRI